MFVKSNKTIEIKAKDRSFVMIKDGIYQTPDWVDKHWYFKACCSDGSITAVVSTKDKDLESADKEAKVKSDVKKEIAADKREIDSKINEAVQEASEIAKENNLDDVTKKNLVKQKVEKAVSKKN